MHAHMYVSDCMSLTPACMQQHVAMCVLLRMCCLRRLQRSDAQEERVGVELALLADAAVALEELPPRAPLRRGA